MKGKRKTVKFWGSPQVTLKPSTAVPPSQPHPAIRELDGDGEGTPRLRGALEAQTTAAPTPALFGASYLSQTGPDAAPGPAGPSTKPPWGDAGSRAHQDPSKDGKKYRIWADFWGNHEWHRRGWEDVALLAGPSPQASARSGPAAGAEHQGLQRSAQRNSRHRRQSGAVDTSVSPDTITCQQLLVHLKFIPNGEHLLVTCSLSAQGSVLAASPSQRVTSAAPPLTGTCWGYRGVHPSAMQHLQTHFCPSKALPSPSLTSPPMKCLEPHQISFK